MNETIENFKINETLLARFNAIRENQQKKVKRGFKTWLLYIQNWKAE